MPDDPDIQERDIPANPSCDDEKDKVSRFAENYNKNRRLNSTNKYYRVFIFGFPALVGT